MIAPPPASTGGQTGVAGRGEPGKSESVRAMFSSIAGSYDLLNLVLSFGLDRSWRREAARVALAGGARRVLDAATGTADLALALKRCRPEAEITGADFAEPMLALGRRKVEAAGLDIELELADALRLPHAAGSFDAVTIAYGLRNLSDVGAGLREFHRVLAPGGRLVVLEFPPPPAGLLGSLFRLYFFRILPLVGGLVSGNGSAYRYLPSSVLEFPPPERLARRMQEAGFHRVRYKLQALGISALHIGEKP